MASKTQELYKDEIAVCRTDPTILITGEFLTIKTKSADLKTFKINSAQKKLLKVIIDRLDKGLPVRIWVLKARQMGMSTLIEALIYAVSSQKANINALIMADEGSHTNNLFEMSKLYHEQLDSQYHHLAPEIKRSNEKKLIFEGIHSQITVATADNLEAARSGTNQLVHLSEVAYFRDLKAVMLGLSQSVPDLPKTMIIGETTANGMGEFYDEWIRAIDGKTDWIPFFLGWFEMEEYTRPLQSGVLYPLDGVKFTSEMGEAEFIKQEKEIKAEYGLTDEQLNWRRYAIVNKCNGELSAFNKEYPACWQDAFQITGKCFFNQLKLKMQKKQLPIATGELFAKSLGYEFRSDSNGRIKIYEKPRKGDQYILTADASEAVNEDEASILVTNVRTNKTAAVVNGQYPPEDIADMGVKLGYFYNTALAAPESKGYGYMVIKHMAEKYGNMYYMKKEEDGEMVEDKTKMGFNTNGVTRPVYLARLSQEVSDQSTELLDKDLIDQCFAFINDPKTHKPQAAPGKEDGLVICRAIASQVRHEHPFKIAEKDDTVEDEAAYNRAQAEFAVGSRF